MANSKQSKRASRNPHADKLTFRLWSPYTEKVLQSANAAGLSPNQFGRLATMAMADSGLLQLTEKLARIEDEMIRLRKDFNDAVSSDETAG